MSSPSIDFYNEAVDAVQAGQLDEALKAAENSLTEDPKDAQTWQLYAVILQALGQNEKAANAMAKVQELGLSEVDELLMKAGQAASEGRVGAAITHYEDALELDDTRGEIHMSYAMMLMEGGYKEDALEASEKSVGLLADDGMAWYVRGRVLRLNGKNEEGLEALTKAVSLEGHPILAKYERGMILVEKGDLEEALKCFDAVLKENPEDPGAIEAKANILEMMG